MKKLLVSIGFAIGLTFSSYAASTSLSCSNTIFTNFSFLSQSPVKVLNVTITTPAATAGRFTFYDTPTNATFYTNAAYSNILSYATNYIAVWTNYYGATNYWTNKSLIDVTNLVAGSTNNYNPEIDVYVPTNSSIQIPNVNALFSLGCWVTNTGTGTGVPTITVQYQQ